MLCIPAYAHLLAMVEIGNVRLDIQEQRQVKDIDAAIME